VTTTSVSNPSPAVHLVTKSGLWLVAKDTDGNKLYIQIFYLNFRNTIFLS
jgi:hypothetical protein